MKKFMLFPFPIREDDAGRSSEAWLGAWHSSPTGPLALYVTLSKP